MKVLECVFSERRPSYQLGHTEHFRGAKILKRKIPSSKQPSRKRVFAPILPYTTKDINLLSLLNENYDGLYSLLSVGQLCVVVEDYFIDYFSISLPLVVTFEKKNLKG